MKNYLNKKLVGLSLALASVASFSDDAAGVTFDSSTKSFTGTFDLTPYYSAIGITVSAIAVVAAVGLALKNLKRV